MILYESGPAPVIRAGELDLAGRRIAARAFAYSGEAGPPAFRFDPVERRLVARPGSGTLAGGPPSAGAWSDGFARTPPGPVLIQGSAPAEGVRGAFRAAAEGARSDGRGAYLLDPDSAGLPAPDNAPETAGAPPSFVALFSWSPARPADLPALSAARALGIPAGVFWPVIPGWTADADFWGPFLERAAGAGASFAVPLAPAADPEFRRLAVEARTQFVPGDSEAFFETMHHRPWSDSIPEVLGRARDAVREGGLAVIPPRPAGPREPRVNSRAAASLEERALEVGVRDEHHSSLLLAAVRWIDACGRDLRPILREGNFSRAFPFGRDLAREAEEAIREAAG